MMYREIIELNDHDDDGKQSPRWSRWSPTELLMEGVSLIALIACFGISVYYWGGMDDEIPVYFIYGVAMAYFSKAYLLITPFAALVLWLLMGLYVYTAQKNAPVKLKSQKFGRMQYLADRFYLGLIKMEILIMLFIMERRIIHLALGRASGNFALFVFAAVLAITLFRYISRRAKIT
jgi:hypothetical protein